MNEFAEDCGLGQMMNVKITCTLRALQKTPRSFGIVQK